jgi:hypothetical protein
MKAEAFTNFTLIYLPVLGLFLFLAIFVTVCIWVFRKNSSEFYKDLSTIPFKKDVL